MVGFDLKAFFESFPRLARLCRVWARRMERRDLRLWERELRIQDGHIHVDDPYGKGGRR